MALYNKYKKLIWIKVSWDESSTKLIYMIIEQYFLVKDDSKISNYSSHSELFITEDDLIQWRAILKFRVN